jgi:hypothetical protein
MHEAPPAAQAATQWRPVPDDQDIYRALVGRRMQIDRPAPWTDPLRKWPWLKDVLAGAVHRAREGAKRLTK